MRFVPANCLREGMRVARSLYGRNSEKLLVAGHVLTRKNISSIQRKGYPGLYIEDDVSRDIEIITTISDELRIETAKGIRRLFTEIGETKNPRGRINNIKQLVGCIIDELLENKDIMVNMIDLKCFDNYTYMHSVNVAVLSIVTGIAVGLDRDTLSQLGLSAILHDIGKVFVNKKIINKPDALTDKEFEAVKKHSEYGYKYTKEQFRLSPRITAGILDHHEKYNGTGYPKGKSGNMISQFGRIITVADIYDALTSERPYRKAQSPSEAMEYVLGGVESIFDPRMATVFIRKIAPYPVGTTVRLSNGYTAIVIENYEEVCLRPKVRVIKNGDQDVPPFDINLATDFNLLNVVIMGIAADDGAY